MNSLLTSSHSPSKAAQKTAQWPKAEQQHAPQQVVRCRNAAEFLAALPLAIGFTDPHSVFVALFRKNRVAEVLRCDLPDPDAGDHETFITTLIELLRLGGAATCDPAVVIYTTETFAKHGAVPRVSLAKQIEARIRKEGWRLRELAIVAGDCWATIHGEEPVQRRSLDEIRASQSAPKIAQQGRPPALSELGKLPNPDTEQAGKVHRQLQQLAKRREAINAHPSSEHSEAPVWMPGTARVAASCFAAFVDEPDTAMPEPRLLAKLIDDAQSPSRWLVLALTALTRAEFVTSLAEDHIASLFEQLPIAPPAIAPGDSDGMRDPRSIESLLRCLSSDPIEAAQLRAAAAACATAAAYAPETHRPSVLALLAWLWWMLGMQSVAERIIQQSLALDPDHGLTQMMARLNAEPPANKLRSLRKQ